MFPIKKLHLLFIKCHATILLLPDVCSLASFGTEGHRNVPREKPFKLIPLHRNNLNG